MEEYKRLGENTVEPPNNGHIGGRSPVHCREVSISEVASKPRPSIRIGLIIEGHGLQKVQSAFFM